MYKFIHNISSKEKEIPPTNYICLVNTLSDLTDDKLEKFEKNKDFESWSKLLDSAFKDFRVTEHGSGTHGRKIYEKRIVSNIIHEFMELAMEKMINEKDRLEFPGKKFGYICVGKRPFKRKSINIHNKKDYGPIIVLSKKVMFFLDKVNYYVTFTYRHRKKLKENLLKGYTYEQ